MPNNSVTTAAIADGAVTASKIYFATLLNNPKAVQAGLSSITYQPNGTGGGFAAITFPVPFNTVPIVFVASRTSGSAHITSVTATPASTTGFQAIGRTSDTVNFSGSFTWLAVDLSKLVIAGA